jgi:uncharacterized membrane protein YeaQ/YmgE (transglycosylase-associated protein family)
MGIIYTIVIGFIVGLLARFIAPFKNEPSGFIMTTILGIVGAFVAYFLGSMLGIYGEGNGPGIIGSIVGAIIALGIYSAVVKNRTAA